MQVAMESKLPIRHRVQQAGILFLRQVVIGFWHIHYICVPKLIMYSFPVAVQQLATRFQPFGIISATTFQVGSRSIAIVFEWHALATHAGTLFSFGHFQAHGFMDIGDTASFVGLTASTAEPRHWE